MTLIYDDWGHFHGLRERECGEHRTVGSYRAWCHDCREWCYPADPCVRCKVGAGLLVPAEEPKEEGGP